MARDALGAARAAEDRARALAGRQGRRAALLARRDQLQAGEAKRTAVRRELDAAGRAAEITKVLDDAERAMAQLATARDAEAGARAAAAAAGLPATAAAADFRAAEQDRRQRVGRLETLREVAGQAGAEDSLAAAARRRAADRATQIGAAGCTLAGLRVRQESVAASRDAAWLAAGRLPLVRAEADCQRAAASDAAQLADDCAGVRDLREQRETAREYANDLREHAQRVREERFDGMIAELAARLTDDSPCPVCGSLDHPDPSEMQARRVTHHEEEQAYAEAEAAKDAVAKLDSELAIVGARVGELIGRLLAADVADPVLREDAALVSSLSAVAGGAAPGARETAVPGVPGPPGLARPRRPPWPPWPRCPLAPLASPGGRWLASPGCRARTRRPGCTPWPPPLPPPRTPWKPAPPAWTPKRAGSASTKATSPRSQPRSQSRNGGRARSPSSGTPPWPKRPPRMPALPLTGPRCTAGSTAPRTWRRRSWRRPAWPTRSPPRPAPPRRPWPRPPPRSRPGPKPAWPPPEPTSPGSPRPARPGGPPTGAPRSSRRSAPRRPRPRPSMPSSPPRTWTCRSTRPPIWPGAQEAVRLAAERHDEAVAVLGRASDRSATLAGLVPRFTAELAALQPLRERAEEARRLADLAAGQGANTLRMTLSSFVLAARLEEVAEAASQRLLTMTAGRVLAGAHRRPPRRRGPLRARPAGPGRLDRPGTRHQHAVRR